MPSLVHLPADAPAAEVSKALARDGNPILDKALSPDAVDTVADELRPSD